MIALLIFIFLVVPIAEITVMVLVADAFGVWPMLISLIAVSFFGGWLVKREGSAAVRRLRETVARGDIPAGEVLDTFLIFCAGVLCVVPGFITDAIGLLLLLPFLRKPVGKRIMNRSRILNVVNRRQSRVINVEYIGDVTPPRRPTRPPQLDAGDHE